MKIFASFLFTLFVVSCLPAQILQNSPYSRYGIGDLQPQYFAAQAGFGETTAFHDLQHLNLANPASFAFLRTTTLDGGVFVKYNNYKSGTSTLTNWTGNLSYLSLGFTLRSPVNEVLDKVKSPWKFGMGFSLTPYSTIGYNVQTRDSLPNLGEIVNSFEGSGGTYRFTWSNGVKYKNTALGINIARVFGGAKYENTTDFKDSLPTFSNNFLDDLSIGGFTWVVGAQHDIVLRYADTGHEIATRWVTLGLTAESRHDISTRSSDRLYIRSRGKVPTTGVIANPDTLLYTTDARSTLTLPATFSLGVQYVEFNKWRIGGQYTFEGWSGFGVTSRRSEDATYRNTSTFSAGLEYIPDMASYNNYGRRMRYRAGAYYRQDPRVVNGQGLNDYGMTIGVGVPITLPRLQTSFINAALEIGSLGADSPISQLYGKLTIGFTLNDNTWFFKRRFE